MPAMPGSLPTIFTYTMIVLTRGPCYIIAQVTPCVCPGHCVSKQITFVTYNCYLCPLCPGGLLVTLRYHDISFPSLQMLRSGTFKVLEPHGRETAPINHSHRPHILPRVPGQCQMWIQCKYCRAGPVLTIMGQICHGTFLLSSRPPTQLSQLHSSMLQSANDYQI